MHANERLIRDAYDAMGRGDGARLAALLTPATEWVIHGEGQLAGTYTGLDEIFGFWKLVAAKTGGGLRLEPVDVLANDDRAVALVRVRGRRNDHELDERQIVVFELDGGRITRGTFVYERPGVYDAFWAD